MKHLLLILVQNFAITALMVIILFVIASFFDLSVSIDQRFIKLRFGLGFYVKIFIRRNYLNSKSKNRWYYGWGIDFGLSQNVDFQCFWF